jgi:hypothetical protein
MRARRMLEGASRGAIVSPMRHGKSPIYEVHAFGVGLFFDPEAVPGLSALQPTTPGSFSTRHCCLPATPLNR